MKKVRVFSSPTCPYCLTLKRFLTEKGIEFEDIDVSQNEEARKEIMEKTKETTVPVLDIGESLLLVLTEKRFASF